MPITGRCTDTRDSNPNIPRCYSEIYDSGRSCRDFLDSKDCDMRCNLCPCSTSRGSEPQHCSGHGSCQALCDTKSCFSAKCKCDSGWTGSKCEIYGRHHFVHVVYSRSIDRLRNEFP